MAAKFELQFDPSCGQATARVEICSAPGGLTSGCPNLTSSCSSFKEFAEEIGELRNELDKMEKEAKEKFGAVSPSKEVKENYLRAIKKLGQRNLSKVSSPKRIAK